MGDNSVFVFVGKKISRIWQSVQQIQSATKPQQIEIVQFNGELSSVDQCRNAMQAGRDNCCID